MSTQSNCPRCGNTFPTSFKNAVEGDAELITHDGELSAIITFNCPNCDTPLVLEDARGPSFGVDTRRE